MVTEQAPWATADLCDDHGDAVQVLDGGFINYGGEANFCGPITTLAVDNDNTLVRTALEEPGQGRVLVVDGQGSTTCALLGGNLGALAAANHWAGVVVDGCVRDLDELATHAVGVRARGACPRRSVKAGKGQRDIDVVVGGVTLRPGMLFYADADGMVAKQNA